MEKLSFSRKKEFLSGLICFLLAVGYLVQSTFIQKKALTTLGAAFIPRVYGFFLLILSVLQMLVALKPEIKVVSSDRLGKEDRLNVMYVLLLLIGYIVLMNIFGFILTSIVYFFLQAVLLTPTATKPRWGLYLGISIIISVITYYLFRNAFHIMLPMGIFF